MPRAARRTFHFLPGSFAFDADEIQPFLFRPDSASQVLRRRHPSASHLTADRPLQIKRCRWGFNLVELQLHNVLSLQLPQGITIDRIVGYGSYFWGGYCMNTSDIDLAVILCRTNGERISKSELADACALIDTSCLVVDIYEIETYRHLTTMMYGKILGRGVILYSSQETSEIRNAAVTMALPYAFARDKWMQKCRTDARTLLADAFNDAKLLGGPPSRIFRVAASAQTAVVLMLWSILYEADIDPSDKAMRWNIEKLLTHAAESRPSLSSLVRYAKMLPPEPIADMNNFCDNRNTRRILRIAHCLLADVERSSSRHSCE
jgi:hypothetical protein